MDRLVIAAQLWIDSLLRRNERPARCGATSDEFAAARPATRDQPVGTRRQELSVPMPEELYPARYHFRPLRRPRAVQHSSSCALSTTREDIGRRASYSSQCRGGV
mmetsp:Transcript_6140/g.15233  ORF Transcript_6140/g.15233 Transcript_6140/m.15233 type:complete len:105 (+) Transcript_6140:64-378(+)